LFAPQNWNHFEYHQHILAPVGEVTNSMERTGVCVDPEFLRATESDMMARAADMRKDLNSWAGRDINWNSWQQLAKFLHDDKADGGLGLAPSPYCKKGEVADDKISTDDRALEWLAGHNPDHRAGIQTLRSVRTHERMARYARTWLECGLPHDDGTFRLHPSFGLGSDRDNRPGAKTGRFGVKNPALNQVPARTAAVGELGVAKDPAGIRRAFIAPPGYRLIVVDYSQLEIVLLSHLIAYLFGDDDPMVRLVRAKQDIHGPLARRAFGELAGDQSVASALIEMRVDEKGRPFEFNEFKKVKRLKDLRDLAKAGIYGKNYGKGEKGFAQSVFLPDGSPLGEERAHLLVTGLNDQYPGTNKYQEFVKTFIEKYGYIVTLYGRMMLLPDARSQQRGLRNRAWRQALNYPMQGGGQEVMALALIAIHNHPRLRELLCQLILVVHDEVILMVPEANAEEALEIVEHELTHSAKLLVPLIAEGATGTNWKDAKK